MTDNTNNTQSPAPRGNVHKLDSLIQEFLTDGIITQRERQVLLRKAKQLGIDTDEADLYIDAQQQKSRLREETEKRSQRGIPCPFCGGMVPQLADICPDCGHTFTAKANEELQDLLDHLEDALENLKTLVNSKSAWTSHSKRKAEAKAAVDRYIREAKTCYEHNEKVQRLVREVEDELEVIRKKEIQEKRKGYLAPLVCLALSGGCFWGVYTIGSSLGHHDEQESSIEQTTPPSTDETSIDWSDVDSVGTDAADDLLDNATESVDEDDAQTSEDDYARKVMSAVNTYLANGEVKDACKLCKAYLVGADHQREDIQKAIDNVVDAMVENEDYNDAMRFIEGAPTEETTEVLKKCVHDMVLNDNPNQAKRFIKRHYDQGLTDPAEAEMRKAELMRLVR